MNQKQPEYTIAFLDAGKRKEIDKETFTELKTKAEILRILQHTEYHYALIGQAYKSFEMSLFEISFDIEHGNQNIHGMWWSGQQKIHIKLVALLNTMHTDLHNLRRSYIKKLEELTSEEMSDIENQFTRSYDTRIEYRVMKALRNCITHAPHADVRGNFNSKIENKIRDIEDSPYCRCYTNNPAIIIDILLDGNRALEQRCKNDLMQMKQDGHEQFDVKFMLRGYIEEVAKIHNMFHKKTESLFNNILNALCEVEMYMFQDTKNLPVAGVRLIKSATENNDGEDYNIGHEFHSRLKDRRQEWKRLIREQNLYYSSGIIWENKKYPQKDSKLWIKN